MVFTKKYIGICFLLVALNIGTKVYGQIQIDGSYMFPSNYRDVNDNETGGRGDFKDIRIGMQIPVYVSVNELEQQTAWAIALQGAYASMNNTDLPADLCISQLLNAELGLMHMRPLSAKWTLTASLGGGIYTDLSEFSVDSILA
jgi:hypothetical protein